MNYYYEVKEVLESWPYILSSIEHQEEYIRLEKERIYGISGQDYSKEKVQTNSGGAGFEEDVIRLADKEAKLSLAKWRVNAIKTEVDKLRHPLKRIIELFYFERRKGGEIAKEMNYEREYCYWLRNKAIGEIAKNIWWE